jgi:hypothetical protein
VNDAKPEHQKLLIKALLPENNNQKRSLSHDVENEACDPRLERFEVDPFVWLEREPVLTHIFFVLLRQDGDFSAANMLLAVLRRQPMINAKECKVRPKGTSRSNAQKTKFYHDDHVADEVCKTEQQSNVQGVQILSGQRPEVVVVGSVKPTVIPRQGLRR